MTLHEFYFVMLKSFFVFVFCFYGVEGAGEGDGEGAGVDGELGLGLLNDSPVTPAHFSPVQSLPFFSIIREFLLAVFIFIFKII